MKHAAPEGFAAIDLAAIATTMHKAHPDVPLAVLTEEVSKAANEFRDAKVSGFLPVLIGRQVKRRLRLGGRTA